MKRYKLDRGITLLALSMYIIVILIVIGIMASIRTFFYSNLDVVQDTAKYAASFDKFNSYFVSDVKSSYDVIVENDGRQITFDNGSIYVYNEEDNGIYKDRIKIATNVTGFSSSKRKIVINSVKKEIITVKIIIGDSAKSIFNKQIDYTLKYW